MFIFWFALRTLYGPTPAYAGVTRVFSFCHSCDWRDKQKNSAPQGGIIFLLNKIGTKSRVTDEGLCRDVALISGLMYSTLTNLFGCA